MAATREELGMRLVKARQNRRMRQFEAAEKLGWTRQTLYQYEIGKRMPSWPTLIRMIEVLELDPTILFPEFFAKGKK
jgi:transcriptional regulator with XRE-family HTH domain